MHEEPLVVQYNTVPSWFVASAITLALVAGGFWLALKTDSVDFNPLSNVLSHAVRTEGSPRRQPELISPTDAWRAPGADLATLSTHARSQDLLSQQAQGGFKLPVTVDAILLVLMFACLMAVLIAKVARESRLTLSKTAITFPVNLLPGLHFRNRRPWDDVLAISATASPTGASQSQSAACPAPAIEIYFKSGGQVQLEMSKLSQGDLEGLLLALEKWGGRCQLAPELIALRHKILSKSNHQPGAPTHTALWEEELRFHFATTNFIPLKAGKTLQSDRLKVIMQLASGGFSAVYLARLDDRVVILKEAVVPPSTEEKVKDKARELVRREAELLMKLNHKQIARVLDHFVENCRDYLVLEYIPGLSLREIVQTEGPQSEAQVLAWSRQIANILAYLHGQDPPLVHRDLTPDNLVVTPQGQIYLIDFGAANEFVGAATGTLIGKQNYIAPEQFRGKAEPASDIYSLGATMHFLLCAQEPEALSVCHPRQLVPELSADIDNLVASCTSLTAKRRLAPAGVVASIISDLQDLGDPAETISLKTDCLEPA